MNVRAKYPYTTVGIPASTSRIGLISPRGPARGVLAEIDGCSQAYGQSHDHGDGRCRQSGQYQRPYAEVENGRLPLGRREELGYRSFMGPEEEQCLLAQLEHDTDGGENREGSRHEEQAVDHRLAGTPLLAKGY